MRVPLDERSSVGEVFNQQISLRDECLEPLQSSPGVRVRALRKPTKGDFDIASNIANMQPERRRGGVKLPPKALGLTSSPRGAGTASEMGKPHLAPPDQLASPRMRCASAGFIFRISSSRTPSSLSCSFCAWVMRKETPVTEFGCPSSVPST
jgi:hypothetical protein